ncbi:MAG TPA: dihydroorotate dehydrogenase electron transfer subunit [Alphaproteobacteria bacterium]|nr:dihydroorotate dehydrogenase electron transfer subunit [Alphaproteobacteria bacterium]
MTLPKLPTGDIRTAAELVAGIVSNEPVNAEYRLMVLDAPSAVATAMPGQFFHLLCPADGATQPFFRRPMSIYRIDRAEGRLSFLYKVTGSGTRTMATLRAGDTINVLGPLGIGFSLPPAGSPIVVLARGVGLATLGPLVPWAHSKGHAVTAILSARAPDLLMSVERMRADGAEIVTVTDAEGTSSPDRVEAILRRLHGEGRMGAIYTCGSNRLMLLAQRLAGELGLFGEVAMEQQMACGLGMCFCCVRSFREGDRTVHRRVCCEGPVFPLQDAMSW